MSALHACAARVPVLLCATMVCSVLASVVISAAEPKPRRAYRIDVTIANTGEDAGIICSPSVITQDRTQAVIHVAKETLIDIDGERVEVPSGTTVRLTPYGLKAGGVKLDIDVEFAEEKREMGVDAVVEKFGMRRIQQLPLGVPVELPVTRDGSATHRVSIKVSEAVHIPLHGVPPAPRAAKIPKPQIRR